MRTSKRAWSRSLLASFLALGGIGSVACDAGGGGGGMQGAGNIPANLARFEQRGPFMTQTFQQGAFSFFVPTASGPDQQFPVATWGNGTATSPQSYNAFLTHIASHGIIVVAANSSNVGTGTLLRQGLDQVEQLNGQQGSRLFQRSNGRACSIGYSQGGGGAVNAAGDPRVSCSVPIAPDIIFTSRATGNGLSRIFFLGGGSDNVAPVGPNAQVLFNQASAPKTLSVLAGANHFEVLGDGGDFKGYATAFLVAQLRDDLVAASLFVGANTIAQDPRYTTQQQN